MIRTVLQRLRADTAGASIVEFALVSPVLLVTIMGLFDLGHNMYTKTMLQGSILQAARNSTIEGVSPAAMDAIVTAAVHDVMPTATMTFKRTAYTNFQDVAQPEEFTDLNGNNICDDGEPYADLNANRTWDTDRGSNGNGGARDAVLYTVEVSYPRVFPIAPLIGGSPTTTTQAETVLRNQPYNIQSTPTPVTENCA